MSEEFRDSDEYEPMHGLSSAESAVHERLVMLACPFCGEIPKLPSGDGTQYEIECDECGMAVSSVQISDLMTIEERIGDKFVNYRYAEKYVERAKIEAISRWNTRAI